MSKQFIRFFNDCEVRVIWGRGKEPVLFSVLDIVDELNGHEEM